MPQQKKGQPQKKQKARSCSKFFDHEAQALRAEKKLRRILKSNGIDEARRWANARGATSALARVLTMKK